MKSKVAFIIALLTLVACGGNKQAQLEKLKKQRDQLTVKIEKLEKEIGDSTKSTGTFVAVEDVKLQPFNHYIEVQGKLDGDENVAVYPETMGVITQVIAHVGQHVSAGQVLARTNDAAYQEQLKALQTNYNLASETFQKQENLWNQHIGSEMQYLQAKAAKEGLESQIAAVKKQIDMTTVKSPISGEVEESMVKAGSAVNPAMPAFRVVNFGSLKVTADLAEAYAAKVNVGDNVIVYFPDIKKEVNAKVTFASNYINPTNRTFNIEARLNRMEGELKANMVTIVKINDYSSQKAVVLPINVIQTDNKGNYVMVAKQENNKFVARKQAMQTGQQYNGLSEVTGLQPGEKVITSGYLNLNDGEAIQF
jgi:membrane fusion protein, multidrug efflux system